MLMPALESVQAAPAGSGRPSVAGVERKNEYEILRSFPPGRFSALSAKDFPDAKGLTGSNRQNGSWLEAGPQRGSCRALIAAVVAGDLAAADRAWVGIDTAFAHQRPDGSFIAEIRPNGASARPYPASVETTFFFLQELGRALPLKGEAREAMLEMADGDGRALLNLIEQVAAWKVDGALTRDQLAQRLMRRAAKYDKSGDEHYNLISALHKSVRGSDPDAALYWFARMLEGGEDPRFLARRITRMAVEDIGLADPQAEAICLDGWQTYERLGSPEGELALAQAVVYLALAPKSNAVYTAYKAARAAARETGSLMPPKHILNAPTKMMKEQGYGSGYAYDHDAEDGFSGQNYFPEGMKRPVWYLPPERGFERELKKRVEYFAKLRGKRQDG